MHAEVRDIPPAPRRVRLRPLFAHRWPLFAFGCALAVLGGLIAWAMFLQSGGKFSFGPRLERGPTRRLEATVTDVGPERHFDDRAWNYVRYTFTWRIGAQSATHTGASFAPAGTATVASKIAVDVLEAEPTISCVVGGVPHTYRRWLYARFWLVVMVVPGALILLAWLAGLLQLRQVLVYGDVSVGRVLSVEPVRWVLPEMLRVQYEFRDHRARLRRNRHWVRSHGALGRRLQRREHRQRDESLPVLHDRRVPHWNRLLLSEDFLLPTT